jgi:hypothetical protein
MPAMLDPLYRRVDEFTRAAADGQPGALACREGCTPCCEVDLSVFPIEAERVRMALAALPADVRHAAADRARRGCHCCLLDPATGHCVVYPARPLICRTHGLAILVDGRVDRCPLNYRDQPPRRRHVLDLDRVNQPLALADHLAGGRGERVRLADVATRDGA